jgi:rhomboid protease GluP
VIACIGIWVGINFTGAAAPQNWELLKNFGYSPADDVWSGAYWALVSSAFVHVEIWHLAVNVYWLWILGRPVEEAIGNGRFAAFFVFAALISSAAQMAVSDSTGIGASGVVYAIFGFMWITRDRYPAFAAVLNARTRQMFFTWLMVCLIITQLGVLPIGNTAHISGLLFGVLAGFLTRERVRLLAAAGLVLLLIGSLVPLAWAPWSVTWLSNKAYDAHAAGDLDRALTLYNRIIERDRENAWAYINRSGVYEALGDAKQAEADRTKAINLNPDYGRSD